MLMDNVREDDVLLLELLLLLLLLLLLDDGVLKTLSEVLERKCICWVTNGDDRNDLFKVNAIETFGRIEKEVIMNKKAPKANLGVFG